MRLGSLYVYTIRPQDMQRMVNAFEIWCEKCGKALEEGQNAAKKRRTNGKRYCSDCSWRLFGVDLKSLLDEV